MNKPFTVKGYWFLPNEQDKKIAGILSYVPGKKTRLEIFGSISQKSTQEHLRSKIENWDKFEVSVIHGHTSDGKIWSLLNCIEGQSNVNLNSDFPLTSYIVNEIIQGILICSHQESIFNNIKVELTPFQDWLGINAFQQSINFKDSSAGFGFKLPESLSFSINNDYDLVFSFGYDKFNVSSREINVRASSFVEIKCKNLVSYRELGSRMFQFQDFLSLGTLSSVILENMIVSNEETDEEGNKQINNYSVFYKCEQKSQNELKKSHDFLFNYTTISSVFREIITRWYALDSEISPIRQYLIESILPIVTFKTNHFLNIIQALEGFHRRFRGKDINLKERLIDIYKEFADIQLVQVEFKDLDETLESAKESRHYYSHLFNPKNNKTKYGPDLYYLTKKLRILLICCVLKEIGFRNNKINEIIISDKF